MECPECRSERVVKFGKYVKKRPFLHLKQRYRCQKCGTTFYEEGEP